MTRMLLYLHLQNAGTTGYRVLVCHARQAPPNEPHPQPLCLILSSPGDSCRLLAQRAAGKILEGSHLRAVAPRDRGSFGAPDIRGRCFWHLAVDVWGAAQPHAGSGGGERSYSPEG